MPKILTDLTASTTQQGNGPLMTTTTQAASTSPSATPKQKGKPPAFSTYFKDPETKANIPLGAIWENTMPDGNLLYGMTLGNSFERDPSKPKYETDKESFLNMMEKFYDGELYINAAHTANRAGGSRSSAQQMLRQRSPERVGAEEEGREHTMKKEGLVLRLLRAFFPSL
jgi:hypothetical protein